MNLRLTKNATDAMNASASCARQLGHDHIGSEHILLSILAIPQCQAVKRFRSMGLDPAELSESLRQTVSGAVWLDPDKTKPYDFYQYWRNVDDADVLKFLRMMTFLPLEQIDEMDHWEGSRLNEAKKILAHELTTLVHGEDEAKKAEAGAQALFGGAGPVEGANVPEKVLTDEDFQEDGTIDILNILVKAELAPSRAEARRNVQQGGVTADGVRIDDFKKTYAKEQLRDGMLVKRGKKKFMLVKYKA